MFDLNDKASGFSKATSFYEYAKGLAILRENLLAHREPASNKCIVDSVTKAIGDLVEQVQGRDCNVRIDPVPGEDAFILFCADETKLKITGTMLQDLKDRCTDSF